MTTHKSVRIGNTLTQASIPKRIKTSQPGRANGLLLRGCVVATYVVDDPSIDQDSTPYHGEAPRNVYCDVMCYSTLPGQRFMYIQKVLVAQSRGGLHSGRVWKPRAAKLDITGLEYVPTGGSNPANWDGDHVLVGFIDDQLNQPVILYGIPHPSQDFGNENKSAGNRMALKVEDGDPDFLKHHGAFYGIDTNGDFVVDTTFANEGEVDEEGKEPAPPTNGLGAQRFHLAQDSEHEITLYDMADPDSPVEVARITTVKDSWEVSFEQGATLKVELKDANAKLTLGDGAVHAAIYEALETFWNSTVKPKFDAFDAHIHTTGVGPSGPPTPVVALPTLATNIKSTKVAFPNG